jgi:hypothetical protein
MRISEFARLVAEGVVIERSGKVIEPRPIFRGVDPYGRPHLASTGIKKAHKALKRLEAEERRAAAEAALEKKAKIRRRRATRKVTTTATTKEN